MREKTTNSKHFIKIRSKYLFFWHVLHFIFFYYSKVSYFSDFRVLFEHVVGGYYYTPLDSPTQSF